jgi:large subunit ribosomal protein L13
MMKTFSPTPADIERRWYVVDADGAVLGRLASEVAQILRGKHKPMWAPHMDTGDHVIVVNASGVKLTGGKETKKIASRHSGYPGGLTETPYGRLMETRPAMVVEKAIVGMLPHNRLGRQMARKLQVYPGPDHPHKAQKPQKLALGEVPSWDGLPERKPKPAPQPKKASTGPKRATAKTAATKKAPATKRSTAKSPAGKTAAAKSTAAKSTAAKSTAAKTKAASSAASEEKPKRLRRTKKEES